MVPSQNLYLIFLTVFLCNVPSLYAQDQAGVDANTADAESRSPVSIAGAIAGAAISGGLGKNQRVSYCVTNAPCAKLCPAPAHGRAILSGTYCFLGRCFCQKSNLARAKDCQAAEDNGLLKACTLPKGISLINQMPGSKSKLIPEFEVCKTRGRARGNYCVFYTDYSISSGGTETPADISQIPELAEKKKRRPRRPGGKKGKRRPKKKPKKSTTKPKDGSTTTNRPSSGIKNYDTDDEEWITSTPDSYFY